MFYRTRNLEFKTKEIVTLTEFQKALVQTPTLLESEDMGLKFHKKTKKMTVYHVANVEKLDEFLKARKTSLEPTNYVMGTLPKPKRSKIPRGDVRLLGLNPDDYGQSPKSKQSDIKNTDDKSKSKLFDNAEFLGYDDVF